MTERTPEEKYRTAIHELGHALGFALWWPESLDVVSIRPGRSHLGVTIAHNGHDSELRRLIDGKHPLDGLDPDAVRFANRVTTMVVLGHEAAELFFPRLGRTALPQEHPIPPQPPAAEGLATLTPLSPEKQEWLDAAEAATELETDGDRAFEQAFQLVGPTANAYLGWIRAEARRLATEYASALHGLAPDLVASEVLDGAYVIEQFNARKEQQ